MDVESRTDLILETGAPVRAASGVARFGDGWLIAQDDTTHAAWWRPGGITAVRVLPPVAGHDVFSAAAGTKHLKPDLEAACEVTAEGESAVLLLGSGSTPARTRACVVRPGSRVVVTDLSGLYATVAARLAVPPGALNLEGACRHGDRLRWFQRGNAAAGVPSASVDISLDGLLAAILGDGHFEDIGVTDARSYDLGDRDGIGLAITDAVTLADGTTLVSAVAEDTPNAVDDGPVTGAALALIDGERLVATADLPTDDGSPYKVEGLALDAAPGDGGLRLVAVTDADDPTTPSVALVLRVSW